MLPRNSAATRNCSCSIQTVDVSIKEGKSKGKEEILLLFLRRARGKLGRASRKTHGKAFWPSALHFRKQALVAPNAPKFNIKQLNLKHKDSMKWWCSLSEFGKFEFSRIFWIPTLLVRQSWHKNKSAGKFISSESRFWVFQPLRFSTNSTNFIFSAKIQIKDG